MEMIVNLKEHSYPIYIEKNILKHANEKIKEKANVYEIKEGKIISREIISKQEGD